MWFLETKRKEEQLSFMVTFLDLQLVEDRDLYLNRVLCSLCSYYYSYKSNFEMK